MCFEQYQECNTGQAAANEKRRLISKITSAKAKITQAENQLADLRAGWKELFPVESHPKWEPTMKKISEKKAQLLMMENELRDLINQQ